MHQIHQASSAWLLGLLAGLYYDALKTLRRRIKRSGVTLLFDLLFWLGLALAIFTQTMTLGEGGVRIFMLATNAIGALLYFLVLSESALFLLGKILDMLLKMFRFLTCPLRKIWAKGKSCAKRRKEDFENWVNYYIIKLDYVTRFRKFGRGKSGSEQVETQKGRYIYEAGSASAGRLRGVQPDGSPRTNRGRKGRFGRLGRGRKRADT